MYLTKPSGTSYNTGPLVVILVLVVLVLLELVVLVVLVLLVLQVQDLSNSNFLFCLIVLLVVPSRT